MFSVLAAVIRRDTKRCTGCYLAWYCGEGCQAADWDSHRAECRETSQQFRPLSSVSNHTGTGGFLMKISS